LVRFEKGRGGTLVRWCRVRTTPTWCSTCRCSRRARHPPVPAPAAWPLSDEDPPCRVRREATRLTHVGSQRCIAALTGAWLNQMLKGYLNSPRVRPVGSGDAPQSSAVSRHSRAARTSAWSFRNPVWVHSSRIDHQAAARYQLPAVYANRLFVSGGGLVSYAAVRTDQYRRVAGYVDRILKMLWGGSGEHISLAALTNPMEPRHDEAQNQDCERSQPMSRPAGFVSACMRASRISLRTEMPFGSWSASAIVSPTVRRNCA